MSSANIGWMFYKETFFHLQNQQSLSLNNEEVKKINEEILNSEKTNYIFEKGKYRIKLTTLYPGLLVGTGYNHDAKGDDNFKMGFFFDYTSGEPMIPGSSVKGVLRSKFKQLNNPLKKEATLAEFECIFSEIGLTKKPTIETLKELELNIFEGKGTDSIYRRDIFYDAFISNALDNNKLFYDDTLAHHKSPFEDPNPIRFLKIRADVKFCFSFDLHEGAGLTAENKKELFKYLLLSSGVGAKTNTGYGQFKE